MVRTLVAALALGLFLAPAAQAQYKEKDVKDGGSISGTVTFSGKAPDPITIDKDVESCGSSCANPNITVNDGKLACAVVYLKKVKEGKAWGAEQKKVVSDQVKCVFTPHVALVAMGGTVEFKNSDSVLHNVKASSLRNGQFNKGVEAGKSLEQVFKSGHDEIKVNCSVHPWMASWVIVMENPYYAVTDTEGKFKLENVPPGKYKLVVWHGELNKYELKVGGKAEKGKSSGNDVEVKKGADTVVDASFGG